jgi:hypothetical protein
MSLIFIVAVVALMALVVWLLVYAWRSPGSFTTRQLLDDVPFEDLRSEKSDRLETDSYDLGNTGFTRY